MASVLVVGAGVSGLTTGVVLAEAGHQIRIRARERSPDTTSDVAAAVWYPLRGERDADVSGWLSVSYRRFLSLAEDSATGIIRRGGMELFREPVDDTWWRDVLPGFRHARPEELPAGYVDGFVTEGLPVIEMPIYLRWLEARLERLGCPIEQDEVVSLEQLLGSADVVVNCAGLGAGTLAGDETLYPVRGQVVRVEQFGLDRFLLDEQHPDGVVYLFPRSNDVVVGGTRQVGDWSTAIDEQTEREILARGALLEPRIRDARIVSRGVGLRPGRAQVRVEREDRDGTPIVHNYGHGGSGVTLSWGCAEAVRALLDD